MQARSWLVCLHLGRFRRPLHAPTRGMDLSGKNAMTLGTLARQKRYLSPALALVFAPPVPPGPRNKHAPLVVRMLLEGKGPPHRARLLTNRSTAPMGTMGLTRPILRLAPEVTNLAFIRWKGSHCCQWCRMCLPGRCQLQPIFWNGSRCCQVAECASPDSVTSIWPLVYFPSHIDFPLLCMHCVCLGLQ